MCANNRIFGSFSSNCVRICPRIWLLTRDGNGTGPVPGPVPVGFKSPGPGDRPPYKSRPGVPLEGIFPSLLLTLTVSSATIWLCSVILTLVGHLSNDSSKHLVLTIQPSADYCRTLRESSELTMCTTSSTWWELRLQKEKGDLL